jgi:hypothetical protein
MVLTCFTLLMPTFSLLQAATLLTVRIVSPAERSPTNPSSKDKPRSFGTKFKPRYIFRAGSLDQ